MCKQANRGRAHALVCRNRQSSCRSSCRRLFRIAVFLWRGSHSGQCRGALRTILVDLAGRLVNLGFLVHVFMSCVDALANIRELLGVVGSAIFEHLTNEVRALGSGASLNACCEGCAYSHWSHMQPPWCARVDGRHLQPDAPAVRCR